MRGHVARRLPLAVAALLFGSGAAVAATPVFHDVTLDAGITHTHGFVEETISTRHMVLAGVAASDYDGDGWTDLYVIRGSLGPNLLYRNLGDGTFQDVAAAAGVDANGDMASGPLFFDANGDGALDLFAGGTRGTPNRLFIADGDGTFTDQIAASGLPSLLDTFSASAADYDRDGDLDLFLTHWQVPVQASHLWRNNGRGVFTCVDDAAGIDGFGGGYDWSFTANFADLNGDAWPDLLVAADFKTSRVFLNRRDGTFADATTPVISDENGMGAAVGDYDNDGDMDWFVSSIFDVNGIPREEWGITGNRMYRNRGDGSFDDATDVAGVREGGWGWGSSFADFDNDGWLDLFHVNGWPFEVDTFIEDPTRLFMNACDGTFIERSVDAGVASTAQGRGVVCFDYDRDGDIDIFISNYRAAPQLLRNDSASPHSWLTLAIHDTGARVSVDAGGLTQTREVSCGNNYLSQNPPELHFGLGPNETIERIRVRWTNGASTTVTDVAANQRLVLERPAPPAATPGAARIASAQPNPFTTDVTLRLEGVGADASVAVFDVVGRRIRDLAVSSDIIRWDGRDARGAQVPAGVYWVRVRDSMSHDTRRIVLVR